MKTRTQTHTSDGRNPLSVPVVIRVPTFALSLTVASETEGMTPGILSEALMKALTAAGLEVLRLECANV